MYDDLWRQVICQWLSDFEWAVLLLRIVISDFIVKGRMFILSS